MTMILNVLTLYGKNLEKGIGHVAKMFSKFVHIYRYIDLYVCMCIFQIKHSSHHHDVYSPHSFYSVFSQCFSFIFFFLYSLFF